jgi:thiol-disulfide isomerase/thioredoxin
VTRRAAARVATLAVLGLLLGGCAAGAGSAPGSGTGTGPGMGASAEPPAGTGMGTATTTGGEQPDLAAARPCPRLAPAQVVPGGLPDLRLPCLGAGPAVRLSDLRGTPLVLNVWAAWCVNCDREMPLFAQAQERAGDRLRFFGVHYKAPRDYGLRSARDFGVTFPSVHDEDGDRTARLLGAPGPPTTLFVTADGRVAYRRIGEITSQQQLTALVRQHLGVRL